MFGAGSVVDFLFLDFGVCWYVESRANENQYSSGKYVLCERLLRDPKKQKFERYQHPLEDSIRLMALPHTCAAAV